MGFGCAARTRFFNLINKQKGRFEPLLPLIAAFFAAPSGGINVIERKSAKSHSSEENPQKCYSCNNATAGGSVNLNVS
jgi:hypothetical protein